MSSAFRLPVLGIVLLFFIPLFLQAKIWTSSDGRTLEAELVEYKDGVAQLKRPDGRTVAVKKEQLSQADQAFLENLSLENLSQVEPQPLPLGAKLSVHSISVSKEMPRDEEEQSGFGHQVMFGGDFRERTCVTLLVQMPDHLIVALDDEASKLTRFSDDKNTDLLQKKEAAPRTGGIEGNLMGSTTNMTTMVRDMGPTPIQARMMGMHGTAQKKVLIDCSAPNRPASGTQTIALEGQIVLQCGQGTKTTEHKNIPLDGSGKFETGGITVAVKKENRPPFGGFGSEMKMQIAFTSNKPLDNIVSYEFLDAQGNEIEWQQSGWMGMGQTQTRYFNLAEEVDSLTIQLEEYEKIETITLPVSLKVGLGL